jgi:hypothetical protein
LLAPKAKQEYIIYRGIKMNIERKLAKVDHQLKKWARKEYLKGGYAYVESAKISFLYDLKDLVNIKVNYGSTITNKDGKEETSYNSIEMTIIVSYGVKIVAGMIIEKIFEEEGDLNNDNNN